VGEISDSTFKKLIESIDKLNRTMSGRDTPTPGGADQIDNATQLEAIEANIEKIRTKQREEIEKIEKLQKKGLADQAELEEAKLNHNKELLSVLYKQASLQEEITDKVAEEIKEKEKELQIKKASLQVDQKAGGLVESYVERLTGIRDMSEDVSVLNARGLQQMAQGLAKLASAQNLAANASRMMVDETTLAVGRMMQARADFVRMTSLDDREFAGQLIDITEATRTLGTTYGENAEYFAALQSQVVGFTRLSEDNQNSMIQQVAALDRLGVSTQTSSRLQGQFMNALGKTSDAALQAGRDAVAMARSYGRASSEVVDAISAITEEMMRYGDQAPEVAAALTEISLQSGVAVNSLSSFFNSAGDVSSLQAAMGQLERYGITGFNAFATFQAQQRGEVATVFEELTRVARAARDIGNPSVIQNIANALGIQVGEMFRLANANNELSAEERTRIDTQQELNELARRAVGPTQKLTAAFNAFAIAVEPISDFLIYILDGFASLTEDAPGIFKALGIIGTAFGSIFTGKLAGAGAVGLIKLLGGAAPAIGGFGAALSAAALPMLAFGAAVGLIASGIGVLAWGIGSMVSDLGSLEEEKITSLESLLGTMAYAFPLFTVGALGMLSLSGFLASLATYSRFADTEALNATADSFKNIHDAVQAVAEQPAAVATVKELLDKAENVADAQAQVEYSILGEIASMTGIVSAVQNMQQAMNTLSDRPVEINVDGRRLAQVNANYTDREARRANIRRNG